MNRTIEILAVFIFAVALIVGWIMNIVAICHTQTFSGMLVARVIGIFITPIGSILGYF